MRRRQWIHRRPPRAGERRGHDEEQYEGPSRRIQASSRHGHAPTIRIAGLVTLRVTFAAQAVRPTDFTARRPASPSSWPWSAASSFSPPLAYGTGGGAPGEPIVLPSTQTGRLGPGHPVVVHGRTVELHFVINGAEGQETGTLSTTSPSSTSPARRRHRAGPFAICPSSDDRLPGPPSGDVTVLPPNSRWWASDTTDSSGCGGSGASAESW